jgi:hypothetical protein
MCKWEKTFNIPVGFSWCQGESPMKGEERGSWMVSTDDDSAKDKDSGDNADIS